MAGTTPAEKCFVYVTAAEAVDAVRAPTTAAALPALPLSTPPGEDGGGGKWRTAGGAVAKRRKARPPPAADDNSLPTLGFKVLANGVEPILPLIRSGHKTIELRRCGARLSDGTVLDTLQPGDRFAGVPLSSALRYRCVMELTGAVEAFASHGAAWEAHGARAVPRALGAIRSAAEAQRFYERSFYDGRVLVDAPVLAIPVAVVRWVEGDR